MMVTRALPAGGFGLTVDDLVVEGGAVDSRLVVDAGLVSRGWYNS